MCVCVCTWLSIVVHGCPLLQIEFSHRMFWSLFQGKSAMVVTLQLHFFVVSSEEQSVWWWCNGVLMFVIVCVRC